MAGSINSTGTGRGAGGRGLPNRRYTSDTIHGGASSSGGGRWRGDRSRGRPPPQPHYRYRPVDAAHRHSSPSAGTEQPAASASARHAQMTHPAAARDKSPASGTVAPAGSNKEPDDKGSRNAANFECNVCFDMAAEPVVTMCGHLFCWECLYQWLHVHSHHRECPVCKGQVAEDAVIPIYGRGGSAASVDKAVHNAPPRPTGARVESSRQQQQHYQQQNTHEFVPLTHQLVYVDDDEDEEDNPFVFQSMLNSGFGGTSIRDAVRSYTTRTYHDVYDDVDMDEQYEDYSYEFNDFVDFDSMYDVMGFTVYSSADNPSSSQMHADVIDLTDSIIPPVHHQEFGYSRPHSHTRGRHGRRNRARALADQSSTDAMVTGASSALYRDNGANNTNGSAGASSWPNGVWAETRGRSNRNSSSAGNSNSAGGRGTQDGWRQRSNYS